MEMRNSGFGLASSVGGIAGCLLTFLLMSAAVLAPDMDENSPLALAMSLLLVAFVLLNALALGFGIAGLFQVGRIKTLATVGIVFSSVTLLLTVCLVAFGVAFEMTPTD